MYLNKQLKGFIKVLCLLILQQALSNTIYAETESEQNTSLQSLEALINNENISSEHCSTVNECHVAFLKTAGTSTFGEFKKSVRTKRHIFQDERLLPAQNEIHFRKYITKRYIELYLMFFRKKMELRNVTDTGMRFIMDQLKIMANTLKIKHVMLAKALNTNPLLKNNNIWNNLLSQWINDLTCGGVKGHFHINGGGFVADTVKVNEAAYIGPNTTVCGDPVMPVSIPRRSLETKQIITSN